MDRFQRNPTRRPVVGSAFVPEGERVALDDFAECMAHGLELVVAGGEAGSGDQKAPGSLRAGRTEVEMDALVGHPDALRGQHVRALDPQDRKVGVECRLRLPGK